MAWRNCKASITLANELNARFPKRDKASDGTIGDPDHASRKSDHNPWVIDASGIGVVRARDIDEDLDGNQADGYMDARVVFEHLLALARAGDDRLNGGGFLIYEDVIYSEKNNWQGVEYFGSNPHDHHLHISFSLNAAGYDSTAPWGLFPTVDEPPKGWLMALNDVEQADLYRKVKVTHLMVLQLQKIEVGKNPKLGNSEDRQLASLTRIEQDLEDLREDVEALNNDAPVPG